MPELTLNLILYGSIALIITLIAMALAYTILSDPEARREIPQVGLLPWVGGRLEAGGQWVSDWIVRIIAFLIGPGDNAEGDGDRLYLKITKASVIISMAISVFSFVGSFAASRDFALRNGIDDSVAAWIPISIDGGILLMVLTIFACSYVGRKCGLIKLSLLALTAVSIMFNVAHIAQVEKVGWIHYLLASIFPAMLFISSEVTAFQIAGYIGRKQSVMTNARLKAEIERLMNRQSTLADEVAEAETELATIRDQVSEAKQRLTETRKEAKQDKAQSEIEARHEIILRAKQANPDITQKELAAMTGVSVRTISNDLKQLNGSIAG